MNEMTAVSLLMVEDSGCEGQPSLVEHRINGYSYSPLGTVDGIARNETLLYPNGAVDDLCQVMALCNDARLVGSDSEDGRQFERQGEPTEAALLSLVEKLGPRSDTNLPPSILAELNTRHLRSLWERYKTLEFDRERKSMSVLCRPSSENATKTSKADRLLVKGAPNLLIERCSHAKLRDGKVVMITQDMRLDMNEKIFQLSSRPLRCLLIAVKDDINVEETRGLINDSSNFSFIESNLTLVAIVGIKDPARPEARDSIELCRKAGIRFVSLC